ncbi:helix-turn-helix transcriptional regulator [Catenulispora sp. NL8]|uniref:Helix-turn-helix transcriptional regulator n=1 Tax=Catenulispora pinistramenti TaxID=2705254 RepID=A0ABS5L6J5_9ACTN|nr:AraC family transcriptional regulator [Catenulispora pinistramenti]MBS2553929.1 helix-turn-helix transcriptional regulator [Catenulispora pinistramenti]
MAVGALPQTCGATQAPVAWLRPGQCGYVGPDLGVDLHAASIGVLTVGLDAPFVLETPEHGAIRTRSVYAPGRARHRVISPEGRILLLFTDPSAAVAMRLQVGRYGLEHRLERELIAACRRGADLEYLRLVADPCLTGGTDRRIRGGATDRRIRRVVDEIREEPARILRAEHSAHGLGMSTPYFLRLFASQTGTTFRRYQQWNRLLEAARGLAAGHNLTRCAADAGFASPSHLSDTFHETFGTTASAVLGSNVRIELDV